MNRKQFLLVLLALATVGGAGLVLINHNRESWSVREAKMGDQVLPGFQFNEVAVIHVRGDADLHIMQTNGSWRVREREDYPANYQLVKDCLIRMRDLKVVQSEAVGAAQLARVELDEPGTGPNGATLIEFIDGKGKVLNSLCVGKRHLRLQDPSAPPGLHGLYDGRYVRLPGDPGTVLLISDELLGVSSEPAAWLNRDFFKMEHVKSVALSRANGAISWHLGRETEDAAWMLADIDNAKGEALAANVAGQIGDLIQFLTFSDVVPKNRNSGTPPEPQALLTIQTFDHFAYGFKVSPKRSDGNYLMAISVAADPVTAENQEKFAKESRLVTAPWDFVVEARIMDLLIRDRAQLLEKKAVASEHSPISNRAGLTITE